MCLHILRSLIACVKNLDAEITSARRVASFPLGERWKSDNQAGARRAAILYSTLFWHHGDIWLQRCEKRDTPRNSYKLKRTIPKVTGQYETTAGSILVGHKSWWVRILQYFCCIELWPTSQHFFQVVVFLFRGETKSESVAKQTPHPWKSASCGSADSKAR